MTTNKIFSLGISIAVTQSVNLTCSPGDSDQDHNNICTEEVTILQCTCVTVQYPILDWYSNELIGPGGTQIVYHNCMTETEAEEPMIGRLSIAILNNIDNTTKLMNSTLTAKIPISEGLTDVFIRCKNRIKKFTLVRKYQQ